MKKEDLEKKHKLYGENSVDWALYEMAYDGGLEFIKHALYRYSTRESIANWEDRVRNGYVYNYSQSIVDLFNFYLTEKPVVRNLGDLASDPQWVMFLADSDLDNTDFDSFMNGAQKLSSTSGSIGILVNKPNIEGRTVSDEIAANVYPYVSLYSLLNIFDWKFERDPITHRNHLSYLKLFEEDESYLIWYRNRWERWELEGKAKKPKMVSTGGNSIEEIPFIWMPNVKRSRFAYLGISDIIDSCRIVEVRLQSCSLIFYLTKKIIV